MPKLNTTIDKLELNTNKVINATMPSASWTDTQYPSAKTLYNMYNKLVHPVGSVYISSTNTDPSSTFGGTWELIDKSFACKSLYDTSIFTPAANITVEAVHACIADHAIRFRLTLIVNTALSDAGVSFGTINWNKLGVTGLPAAIVDHTSFRDSANGGIIYSIWHQSGEIQQLDTIDADSIPSGQTFTVDVPFAFDTGFMLDSACDKFYWKRTA